jgi:hypothetical protein
MRFFINYSFDSDCVHTYVNKLIQISQTAKGWSKAF